jgi:hypothetical protein
LEVFQPKNFTLMQNRDMSNADQNPLDIHRRFAALERRITKLEAGLQEVDRVVDPEGWIGEAFELMEKELSEVKQDVKSIDRKIDTILQHITGMNRESE